MNIYVIDTSWLLHRGFHAIPDSLTISGVARPIGHIKLLLQSYSSLRKKDPQAKIIYCLDSKGQRPDGYKAQRENLAYDIFQDLPGILNVLMFSGAQVAESGGAEADRVILTTVRKFEEELSASGDNGVIRILSGDSDIYQAVSRGGRVKVISSWKDDTKEIGWDEIVEKMGVTPPFVGLYKAITGDTSDNIDSAVPRIPREVLAEMCRQNITVDTLGSFAPSKESQEKWKSLLIEAKAQIQKNLETVALKPCVVRLYRKSNKTQALEFLYQYQMEFFLQFMNRQGLLFNPVPVT